MEIELKLALPASHAGRIRRHPLLREIKPSRHKLYSVYFDTPDFALMRRGIALRLRRVGYHWVQTMKAEARAVGAMSSRPEWEMAVASGIAPDFAVLPQAALDLLQGIDLTSIAPAFVTQFQRTTWHLVDGENEAELALDMGEIGVGKIQADEATQPSESQAICEIEIELKSGQPVVLFDLAEQLLASANLFIEARSKAERGYTLCGATTPAPVKTLRPDIQPKQSATEVWQALMQAALVQLVANVPGVLERTQDIEYLHQLRIALRRLRTGMTLAKGKNLPPIQTLDNSMATLHEVMCSLNPARDWDVFLHETLPRTLTALGANIKDASDGPNEIAALFSDLASNSRRAAQACLQSAPFTRLVLDLGRMLLPADKTAGKEISARQWAAGILEKRWMTLRKRCRRFAQLSAEERHRARIAAKKLRYAADALVPLYGKRGSRFIAALADLQNALGRANDAQVGIRLLNTVPKKNIEASFDLGRIEGALQVEATRNAQLSAAIWQRLARSRRFWRDT